MKIPFYNLLLAVVTICFIFTLIDFATKYKIILISKPQYRVYEETNKTEPHYGVDCYSDGKVEYCTFPDGDYKLYFPQGKSMYPYMMGNGEMLLCDENFTLEENGIYSYNVSDYDIPIVHRCIELTETGCIFRGDNNNVNENITNDEILCRVEWLIREIN